VELAIRPGVAPIETRVDVTDSATLLDPNRAANVNAIGSQAIAEHLGSQPGRGLLDLISAQPGWLYEANGVPHPRVGVRRAVRGGRRTDEREPVAGVCAELRTG
jgi:hypothetical protein